MSDQESAPTQSIRVVAGRPTPAEIAALVAVLSAAGGGGEADGGGGRSGSAWSSPGGRMRHTHSHGFGAWRGSALPR